MDDSLSDGVHLLKRLMQRRKVRLLLSPFRMVIAVCTLSLAAGGPRRFLAEPPGQIFALLYAIQVVLERYFQPSDAGGKSEDRSSAFYIWIAFGVTYLVAIAEWYWIRPRWSLFTWNWIWLVAGAALVAAGQIIRIVAIRTLGRFFTKSVRIYSGQKVIQGGIYARVRHPAYTGFLLAGVGIISPFASVLGYAAFVLFCVPAILYRIHIEENALIAEFGDEYRDYRRRTKRLIPLLY